MKWEYISLGRICKTSAGGTPLKSEKDYYENGSIPWLRSGEVNNKNIVNSEIKITKKGLINSSAKLFPSSTVLIAMYGATAGNVGILNFRCSTNQAVCGILPNENYLPEFLYYFFLDFKNELISQAVGNAQPNISQAKIKNTLIPIVALSEQKQIVILLDQALAAIDQAKENIEQNIANAKVLFQSKLNEIFSQQGEGWEEKTLGEVIKLKSGSNLTAKKMINGEFPVIGGNGIAGYHNDYNLQGKNIVIGRVGALCGNVRYYSDKIWLTDNAFKLDEIKVDFDLEFLTVYLNYLNLRSFARQAAQPVISNSSLKNVVLSFPKSINQQIDIKNNIYALEYELRVIKEKYTNKLSSLIELKKSILQKAFAGELTSTGSTTAVKAIEEISNMAAEPETKYKKA